MKAEIWLPILTLAIGWAGAQATEMLRDRRTSEREREASKREREARQAELQRGTLLELQDALLKVSNSAGDAHAASFVTTAVNDRGEPSKQIAEDREREARDRLSRANDGARLLASRVQDDQARQAVKTFLTVASMAAQFNPETAEADMKRLHGSYRKAIDLLGELIRERY
jgi:hypothetical protein